MRNELVTEAPCQLKPKCTRHPGVLASCTPPGLFLAAHMPRKRVRPPGQACKRKRQPSSGAWSDEADDASSGAWAGSHRKRTGKKTKCMSQGVADTGAWADSDLDSGAWSSNGEDIPCKPAAGVVDGADLLTRSLGRMGKDTKYSRDGKCRARISQLLANTHSSACVCTSPCFVGLSTGVVGAVADAYWDMSDEERAVILHSMYTAAAYNSKGELQLRRIKWKIQQQVVCFKVFCALLGTSENTLRKYIKGDWVPKLVYGRARTASICVDFFFQSLYQSAAEPLPHNRYTTAQRVIQASRPPNAQCDADCLFDHHEHMWEGQPLNPAEGKVDTEELSLEHPLVELQASLTQLAQSPCADLGLSVRYLPHNPLIHYYWVFVSSWDSILASAEFYPGIGASWRPDSSSPKSIGFIPCPSYHTFCRRYRQVWAQYLRIRKQSQHAQCNTCFELQREMHGARNSMQARLTAARALRQHYQDQEY